jgi:hypothetical protein
MVADPLNEEEYKDRQWQDIRDLLKKLKEDLMLTLVLKARED